MIHIPFATGRRQTRDTGGVSRALFDQLAGGGVASQAAADAINSFTRRRMGEDGFFPRIMPPLHISNDELDRAVDTDLPVRVVDAHPGSGPNRARDWFDQPELSETTARRFREQAAVAEHISGMDLLDQLVDVGRNLPEMNVVRPQGERIRGISANAVIIDEVADMPADAANLVNQFWQQRIEDQVGYQRLQPEQPNGPPLINIPFGTAPQPQPEPAALTILFGTLPQNMYIRGPRYRVAFDRAETPRQPTTRVREDDGEP